MENDVPFNSGGLPVSLWLSGQVPVPSSLPGPLSQQLRSSGRSQRMASTDVFTPPDPKSVTPTGRGLKNRSKCQSIRRQPTATVKYAAMPLRSLQYHTWFCVYVSCFPAKQCFRDLH